MTICIAALAEQRRKLVLAADQMITANIPIAYQFETDDVKKIYDITDSVTVLTAGNALYAYEIVEDSQRNINSSLAQLGRSYTIEEIADKIREEYQNYRRNLVIKNCLEPRGLNLQTYYQLQQSLHIGVVQEIEKQLSSYNMGVDLVVAGHNQGDECHVYSINHPGVLTSHDAIGYVCVGSGAPHAFYYLLGSNYNKELSIKDVEELVREAKKRSEVAPGVGRETTVCILPRHTTD